MSGSTQPEPSATPESVAPASAADPVAVQFGLRALELAGQLLGFAGSTTAELSLAQLLLREALVATARALSGQGGLSSLEEALAALDRVNLPSHVTAERVRAAASALAPATLPSAAALREAERTVTDLARLARGKPKGRLARLLGHWARTASFLAIVLCLAGLDHAGRAVWETYTWRVSSSASGFSAAGTLGDHGLGGLLLNTEQQQNPWVVVDMQSERDVERVVVGNARNFDRGVPLLVEVGTDGQTFHTVARRNTTFDTWTADFPVSRARYLRLRSKANTSLRLREIQVP